MSSRPLLRIRKTVALKLTLWYCAIFTASALLLFALSYIALSSSLAEKDREAIKTKLDELAAVFESSGLQGVKNEAGAVRKFERTSAFFIRVADTRGMTLFLSIPSQWTEFELSRLEGWAEGEITVPQRGGGPSLAVLSRRVSGDHLLQVGKSTEERDAALSHFRGVFSAVVLPLILAGFVGGAFLGYRALSPLRNLLSTIRSIREGVMEARVVVPATHDELEELARLFNAMVETIETLVKAMRQSLDNVAHDLRTPLTRLRGMAEIALSGDSTKCREVLADCIEESERILAMLDTLLDISEAETGVSKLEITRFEGRVLLERIAELYSLVAEEKGVSMSVSAAEDLYLEADFSRMSRVIANLVDNAVKYTPQGGSVALEAWEGAGKVFISVTDTGCGISREELPRIWDRLYRGDKSRSEKGLGLGLSLVKAVVEAHGGEVSAESEPSRGSRFLVTLPRSVPRKDITHM